MRTAPITRVGDRPPARVIGPITHTDIVRFAGAGGDLNRLHHDPDFAVSAGFTGVIAMGQMQAGMLAGYLTDWCGVENLRSYSVRFVLPVRPGDLLTLTCEVVQIEETAIGPLADIDLRATCNDFAVITARAEVVVAR